MTGASRPVRPVAQQIFPKLEPKLGTAVARSVVRFADPFIDVARRYLELEGAVYPDDDSSARAYFAAQERLEAELHATAPQSLGSAIVALHIVHSHGQAFALADIDLWLLGCVMELLSREI